MKENKKKKIAVIAGVSAIVILAVGLLLYFFVFRERSYRSIRAVEVSGDVSVKRDQKSKDVYEDMILLSGDKITTEADSELSMKLDEDKFVVLKENSILKLEATGNAKTSKTRLNLVQGEVYSDIANKLSKDSTYEVVTPGSTISVRGTKFNVVFQDKKMSVSCDDGEVRIVLNGTNERMTLQAGESVEYTEIEDGVYSFEEAPQLDGWKGAYQSFMQESNKEPVLGEDEKEAQEFLLSKPNENGIPDLWVTYGLSKGTRSERRERVMAVYRYSTESGMVEKVARLDYQQYDNTLAYYDAKEDAIIVLNTVVNGNAYEGIKFILTGDDLTSEAYQRDAGAQVNEYSLVKYTEDEITAVITEYPRYDWQKGE